MYVSANALSYILFLKGKHTEREREGEREYMPLSILHNMEISEERRGEEEEGKEKVRERRTCVPLSFREGEEEGREVVISKKRKRNERHLFEEEVNEGEEGVEEGRRKREACLSCCEAGLRRKCHLSVSISPCLLSLPYPNIIFSHTIIIQD